MFWLHDGTKVYFKFQKDNGVPLFPDILEGYYMNLNLTPILKFTVLSIGVKPNTAGKTKRSNFRFQQGIFNASLI